jgi:hypothetical protein
VTVVLKYESVLFNIMRECCGFELAVFVVGVTWLFVCVCVFVCLFLTCVC